MVCPGTTFVTVPVMVCVCWLSAPLRPSPPNGAPVTIFTSDGVVAPSNVDISDVEKAVEAYKRKEQNRYSDDRKDSDLENRLRALEQENDKLSRELDDLKRKIK